MKNLNLFARIAGTNPIFKLNDLAYLSVLSAFLSENADAQKYAGLVRDIINSMESDEDFASLVSYVSGI